MFSEGSFTMENCRATTPGWGGLRLGAPDSVRFLGCLFEEFVRNGAIGVWVTYSSTLRAREVVFEDCTFQNSNQGLYLAAVESARVERCTFLNVRAGGQATVGTRMTVEDCRFEGSDGVDLGIQDQSMVTLQRCWLGGGSPHTRIQNVDSHLSGSGNFIGSSREETISLYGTATISMQNNTILNGGGWSVTCLVRKENVPGIESFDLTNNYWGTTDRDQIREWIGDEEENPLLVRIDFEPFLDSVVSTQKRSFGSFKDLFGAAPSGGQERE
jgi:polygalacturonase